MFIASSKIAEVFSPQLSRFSEILSNATRAERGPNTGKYF